MASVRKRKWTHNGVQGEAWVVDYTDQTGKRRSKQFDRKKDADKFRMTMEQEVEKGIHVPDSQTITVKEACEHFIRNAEQRWTEGRLGQSRLTSFKTVVDHYLAPHLGARKMNALNLNDVEDWHTSMLKRGLAPVTARQYLVVGKQIEEFAKKRKYTSGSVFSEACGEVRGVKARTIRTFTIDDVRTLLETVGIRKFKARPRAHLLAQCFVNLAAFCGLRYGEIAGLTLSNVNFDERVLHVRHSLTQWDDLKGPKTKSGIRDVPLPDHIAELIRDWLDRYHVANDRDLIFRGTLGQMIQCSTFNGGYWRPLLLRAGLIKSEAEDMYHFHALRHFAASLMIECGLPLTDVASLMGHSKFDMTLQVYAHPIVGGHRRHDAMQRMAAAMVPDAANMRQRLPSS